MFKELKNPLRKFLIVGCCLIFIGMVIQLNNLKNNIINNSIHFHQSACQKSQQIAKQYTSDIIDCIKEDDPKHKIRKVTIQYKQARPGLYDSMSFVDVPCYVNGNKTLKCDVLLRENDDSADSPNYDTSLILDDKLSSFLEYD